MQGNAWKFVAILSVIAVLAVAWALTPSPEDRAAKVPPAANVTGSVAPDISNLTPREQFGRLADKVETAMENNDTNTVVTFYPMAEGAFTNLSTAERDIDARFHVSLLRARVSDFDAVLAQADTIVAEAPNHLFADYLRAITFDLNGDTSRAREARANFKKNYPGQMASNREEYQAHQQMLSDFLKTVPN